MQESLPTRSEFCCLHVLPLTATALRPEAETSCSICMETFDPTSISTDVVVLQPCSHFFHACCICTWINSNNQRRGECPNCRRALFLPDPLAVLSNEPFMDLSTFVAIYPPPPAIGRPSTRRGLSWLFGRDRRERSHTIGFGSFEETANGYAFYNPVDLRVEAEDDTDLTMPPARNEPTRPRGRSRTRMRLQMSLDSITDVVESVTNMMVQDPLRADVYTDRNHFRSADLDGFQDLRRGEQVNINQYRLDPGASGHQRGAQVNTTRGRLRSSDSNEASDLQHEEQVNTNRNFRQLSDTNEAPGLERGVLDNSRRGLGLLRRRRNSSRAPSRTPSRTPYPVSQLVPPNVELSTRPSNNPHNQRFRDMVVNFGRRLFDTCARSSATESAVRHARVNAQEAARRVVDEAGRRRGPSPPWNVHTPREERQREFDRVVLEEFFEEYYLRFGDARGNELVRSIGWLEAESAYELVSRMERAGIEHVDELVRRMGLVGTYQV